jgi:hypothetical protein
VRTITATTRTPPPTPAPMPAFAPTERPESGAEEDVALLLGSLVGATLEVGVTLAVMTCAASLVDADGFESE